MFQNGFPKYLINDKTKVVDLILNETKSVIKISETECTYKYFQDGSEIIFPSRMYHDEVSDKSLNKLSLQQKMILHCIYSRSHDGYIRQKHINSLLLMDYADWTIPYIMKLCDEYVIEILETIYGILKNQDTTRFKELKSRNLTIILESYDRMVSYWNEYYRYNNLNLYEYIGFKLFSECFGLPLKIKRGKLIRINQ